MKTCDLDYSLSPTAAELLLALVDTAKQYQIETIPCREVWVRKDVEIEDTRRLSLQQDPLGSLQKIGLVERLDQYNVYLRADAFERAKYERKNRLGKWLVKAIYQARSLANATS